MLKKPVFRICLVGTYGVAQRSKLSDYPDYWSDGGTDLQANSDSRNFCQKDPIGPEFLNNATYYTLSEETAAPIPEEEKGGRDGGYGERVPHDGGERDGGGERVSTRTI